MCVWVYVCLGTLMQVLFSSVCPKEIRSHEWATLGMLCRHDSLTLGWRTDQWKETGLGLTVVHERLPRESCVRLIRDRETNLKVIMCYGLTMSPLNSYVEALIPNMIDLRWRQQRPVNASVSLWFCLWESTVIPPSLPVLGMGCFRCFQSAVRSSGPFPFVG